MFSLEGKGVVHGTLSVGMRSAAFEPAVALHVAWGVASQPADECAAIGGCSFLVGHSYLAHVEATLHHAASVVEVSSDTANGTIGYGICDGAVVSAI